MSKKHAVSEKVSALIANALRVATLWEECEKLSILTEGANPSPTEGIGEGCTPLFDEYCKARYGAVNRVEMGIAIIQVSCKLNKLGQARSFADDVQKYIAKLPGKYRVDLANRFELAVANIPDYRVTTE